MTDTTWRTVARSLLGTWPSQVGAWGEDGLQAYLKELAARGITPDTALTAIRAYNPDADFPPSAAKLAQLARRDPTVPAGLEIVDVLWGPDGVMHARDRSRTVFPGPDGRKPFDDQARRDAAVGHGPLLTAFMDSVGLEALKNHDPSDLEWGEANRRWLQQQWDEFRVRADERGVAEMLAAGNLDGLGELRRRNGRKQIEA